MKAINKLQDILSSNEYDLFMQNVISKNIDVDQFDMFTEPEDVLSIINFNSTKQGFRFWNNVYHFVLDAKKYHKF